MRDSNESDAISASRSGSVNGAMSTGCSDTQPSRPGRVPWPDQMTSPAAVSSSSMAGE